MAGPGHSRPTRHGQTRGASKRALALIHVPAVTETSLDEFAEDEAAETAALIRRDRLPPRRQNAVRGWPFIYDEATADGKWGVGWDLWEEWFFEIMRYPPEYSRPLVAAESTSEVVTL